MVCVCMCVCVCACMPAHMHVCVCVCVCVCMPAHMHVCVCVCVHMWLWLHFIIICFVGEENQSISPWTPDPVMWCPLSSLLTWILACSYRAISTANKSWKTCGTRTKVCAQRCLPWNRWWSPWVTQCPQLCPLSQRRRVVNSVTGSRDCVCV